MERSLYIRALAHYPYVILITVFLVSTTFLIIPLLTEKFPDFSDPQLGFEARGTEVADRLISWRNLMDGTNQRGELNNNPLEYYFYLIELERQRKDDLPNTVNETIPTKHKHKKNHKKHKKHHQKGKNDKHNKKELKVRHHEHFDEEDHVDRNEESARSFSNNLDQFFCNAPSAAYARMVISSDGEKQNLWTMEGIVAQCQLDKILRASPDFPSLCERQIQHKQKCCRSWSPANYIALMSNRSSCSEITDEDLKKVKNDLRSCSYYYRNHELVADCANDDRCQRKVPEPCYMHNAAYNLLHYLLDVRFLTKVNSTDTYDVLHSAMIILPMAASSAALVYYDDISRINLIYDDFQVVAMQLGLKSTLFDRLLVSDSYLVLFGFCFVTVCIWFYTGSVLITLSTVLVVIFSLGVSYATYTLVYQIKLFPFMNILAVVVAVGIGSDDAFVFCKLWECKKVDMRLNPANDLLRLVSETMKHALPTILVTTLTTAVAFFSSMVSKVTAINCFSIFSGTTVLINFFLMITWLPASVVIAERWNAYVILSANSRLRTRVIEPVQVFFDKVIVIFTSILTKIVMIFKWVWISIFLILTIGGCFVIFHYPGLQLPNSPDFQLFDSKHLFEQYDLFYSKRFWFERFDQGDGGEVLPMRFIWGVKPVDNGNTLDPHSRGHLEFDKTFDVTARESQVWLHNFCKNLRLQPFYRSTLGPLLPNCFIESLQTWMERPCEDLVDEKLNYMPCCRNSTFPYDPNVLKHCAAIATAEIYKTPTFLWNFGTTQNALSAGLKFRREDNTNITSLPENDHENLVMEHFITDILAVVVEYDSNFTFSLSFAEMDDFYNQVESWMQEQLLTAPAGMKNGWFVSYLEFYELQRTLYDGTIWSIVVSMGLALSVIAVVTLNPFISFYATVTIVSAIIITVAILILMGWKLNVLESIAVSTAIGLAIDFTLHYSVSYRESEADYRRRRVKESLRQMGGPTLMAALTSAAAGALMLPSRVLPYIQIGIFLILIMAVSWLSATFFLCPMLAVGGPHGKFAQYSYLCLGRFFRGRRGNNLRVNHSSENNGNLSINNRNELIPLQSFVTNNDTIA